MTLDRTATDRSLAFIRECCAQQAYPVKFLHRTMGCSEKTAGRILSTSRPYTSLLKRAYAAAFAVNLGYPLECVTQPADTDYADALKGWPTVGPASMATKVAAVLGAGIATRAMRVYGLLADFTVSHGIEGRPSVVSVAISKEPNQGRHILAIAESSYTGGMLVTHFDSQKHQRCQLTPTEESIDRILKTIKK